MLSQGRWFPSHMVTTYYAARLLDDFRFENLHSTICNLQSSNGSWRESVIETAAAIRALRVLAPNDAALGRARAWLLTQRESGTWRGEPMLYYWFEDGGEKLFYHCADKGEITTAWAMLALDATAL